MAKVYMVVGNVGAGKSTFAHKLAEKKNAHVFTVDEWMKNLFWMDAPEPPSYQWALERTERIDRQILLETVRLTQKGLPVILDIGFFTVKQRKSVLSYLKEKNVETSIYYLDVDKHTRWKNIERRNQTKEGTYQFDVSKDVFEFCETLFEPLTEEEKQRVDPLPKVG